MVPAFWARMQTELLDTKKWRTRVESESAPWPRRQRCKAGPTAVPTQQGLWRDDPAGSVLAREGWSVVLGSLEYLDEM